MCVCVCVVRERERENTAKILTYFKLTLWWGNWI